MVEPGALDVTLTDVELPTEIDLATELMIAGQAFDRPLSQDEIDEILRLPRQPGGPPKAVKR